MGSSGESDFAPGGELKFSWLMGGERQMGGFRKFNEKWGKKVQNLGIIFQIDMKRVYISCICVFTAGNCYFC